MHGGEFPSVALRFRVHDQRNVGRRLEVKLRGNVRPTGDKKAIDVREIDRAESRVVERDFRMRRKKLAEIVTVAFPNP